MIGGKVHPGEWLFWGLLAGLGVVATASEVFVRYPLYVGVLLLVTGLLVGQRPIRRVLIVGSGILLTIFVGLIYLSTLAY